MIIRNFLLWLIFCLVVVPRATSQTEVGAPLIENFTRKVYGGEDQNFDIIQSKNGWLYVANGAGVLIFDGVRWQTISVEFNAGVLRLAESERGTIYVGGLETLGFLETDESGLTKYQSLLPVTEESVRDFYISTATATIADKAYFVTDKYLLCYDGNDVKKVLDRQGTLADKFVPYQDGLLLVGSGGNYVIDQSGKVTGLDTVLGAQSQQVIGFFFGKWLIKEGAALFWLLDGERLRWPDGNALAAAGWFAIDEVGPGLIAWGSFAQGVYLVDDSGRIQAHLSTEEGLANDRVYRSLVATDGSIWSATDIGLSQFLNPALVSQFSSRNAAKFAIESIARFDDEIHVGRDQGIQILANEKYNSAYKGVFNENFAFSIRNENDELFGACQSGFIVVRDEKLTRIDSKPSRALLQVPGTGHYLVARTQGLDVLSRNGDLFSHEGSLLTELNELRSVVMDKDGKIWVGTFLKGVVGLNLNLDNVSASEYKVYGVEDGLAVLNDNEVFRVRDKVIVAAPGGLKIHNPDSDRFIPYSEFGTDYSNGSHWIYRIAYDDVEDEVWLASYEPAKIIHISGRNSQQVVDDQSFAFMKDRPAYAVYPESNGVVWFGGPEGLVKFDRKHDNRKFNGFQAQVRQLKVRGDSVVREGPFGGEYELPNSLRDVRFEVTANFLYQAEQTEFRYQLVGYDPDWSEWTSEAFKSYTNLSDGSYEFNVIARNVYNELSETNTMIISIAPFWYETKWFSAFLILGLATLVFGSVKYIRERRLLKKAEADARVQAAVIEEQERGLKAVYEATEDERRRIAKDLHDGLGQQLTAIKMGFQRLSVATEDQEVNFLKKLIDETAREARDISHKMMPRSLVELGLVPAIEDMLSKSFRPMDVTYTFEHFNLDERYEERLEITIYRIIQELINNVIKHSEATTVAVQLFKNREQLILVVEDDGRGLKETDQRGNGLLGIKHRLNALNGKVNWSPSPEAGTTATISIPII